MVVVVRRFSARPHLFLRQTSGQISKEDVNGLSSISDIFFMAHTSRHNTI
jgi:hypothetical protein